MRHVGGSSRGFRWWTLLGAMVLLAACAGGEGADEAVGDAPAGDADDAPEEDADDAVEAGAPADGERVAPVVVDVDFEERAPDGTTVRVSRFEVTDLAILVDVEVIVAAEQAFIQLNNWMFNPAFIVDDQGNDYPMIPPEDNKTVRLQGGERLEGTLSFQGPLHRGVRTVQLLFNRESNPEARTVNDQLMPYFAFPPVEVVAS